MEIVILVTSCISGCIGAVMGYFYSIFDWQMWFILILLLYTVFSFSRALEELSNI